ncbi:hypothetical protein, partial [Micromonospora sp. WMMD736]|uniref:hypothetical protein n=1 Tax=Micromonospora sp. WMMD736 TaxID=3404112 RepID=UPI003B9235D8
GDNERLYSQLRQIVDSPIYVVDPLIEAIADTLPTELGGGSDNKTHTSAGDGAFMQFRNNELLGLRDAINEGIKNAVGATENYNQNYAWALAQGMLESAERTATGAALGVAGLIPIAQAIAEGNNADLYVAIRQYTDAPLWTVDPVIEGLAQALPESLGGGSDGDFTTQAPEDGALMTFRNQRLWTATRDTRRTIAGVLDVELDAQDNPVPAPEVNISTLAAKVDPPTFRSQPNKFTPGSQTSESQTTKPKPVTRIGSRLQQAAERADESVKSAVSKLTKSITSKKKVADNDSAGDGQKKKGFSKKPKTSDD